MDETNASVAVSWHAFNSPQDSPTRHNNNNNKDWGRQEAKEWKAVAKESA